MSKINLNYKGLLAEYLGTFIFVYVILLSGNPYIIVLTLLIVILLSSAISGGHINPAVSTAMALNGSITLENYFGYISVQLLAAASAYYIYKTIIY